MSRDNQPPRAEETSLSFRFLVRWERFKMALTERWLLAKHYRRCSPRKPTLHPEDHGDRVAYRCGLCGLIVDVEAAS